MYLSRMYPQSRAGAGTYLQKLNPCEESIISTSFDSLSCVDQMFISLATRGSPIDLENSHTSNRRCAVAAVIQLEVRHRRLIKK